MGDKKKQTESPRFLMYGITGVYNYGCEAIVRGTALVLREMWPECHIAYASHRCEEDRKALRDCEIEIIPTTSRYTPRRMIRSGLRRLGLPVRVYLNPVSLSRLKRYDCVLSIGGDLYTMPRPEPVRHYLNPLVDFGERVFQAGKTFVIWGASIGPFDSNPWAIPLFVRHFKKVSLITTREQQTYEYLASLGIQDNVWPAADPAYLMPADSGDLGSRFARSARPLVGVNLSPLSARRVFPERTLEDLQESASAVLKILVEKLGVDVLLIPHVICHHDMRDDDYRYLTGIRDRLSNRNSSVQILPAGLGGRRTKLAMGACDVIVAARMHCAIAAISSRVPTLLVGYSAKAHGMAQYVYGHSDWVVSLSDLTPQLLLSKVHNLLVARESIVSQLNEAVPRLEKSARNGGQALARVLRDRQDQGHWA